MRLWIKGRESHSDKRNPSATRCCLVSDVRIPWVKVSIEICHKWLINVLGFIPEILVCHPHKQQRLWFLKDTAGSSEWRSRKGACQGGRKEDVGSAMRYAEELALDEDTIVDQECL